MQLNGKLLRLQKRLGLDTASMVRLKNAAHQAQRIENKYNIKVDQTFKDINKKIAEEVSKHGTWTAKASKIAEQAFLDLVITHAFETMQVGLQSAVSGERNTRPRLASPPKGRMPRKFKDLMAAWDMWRKKKKVQPKYKGFVTRAMAEAGKIKAEYLKKTRSAFERYSRSFREGEELDRFEVVRRFEKVSGMPRARAHTTVNTETTHYYNNVRRQFYDLSEDVTHYLFLPVRDFATTKWCKTRDGVVYAKGSSYLDKETPPIHWNCRSELLPLTPANPTHLRLIKDKSRQRANRRPAKLHPKWAA